MEEKKIKILTEEEMDKNWKDLDHTECCLYQKMSLDFVKKHVKDIDWPSLSVNPNLTTDIIDKYIIVLFLHIFYRRSTRCEYR